MGGPIEAVVAAVSGAMSSAAALVTGKAPEENSDDQDGRQGDEDLERAGRQGTGDSLVRPGHDTRGIAGGRGEQLTPAADQQKEPFSSSTGHTNPHSSSAQNMQPPKRHKSTNLRPQQPQVPAQTGLPAQPKPPPAKAEAADGDGPGPTQTPQQPQQQQQQEPSDFVQRQHFGPSKLGSDQVHGSMAPMAPMAKPPGVQPGTSFSVTTSNNTHSETSSLTTTERGPGTSNKTTCDAAGSVMHQAGGRQAISDDAGNTQVYEAAPTAEGDSFEKHTTEPAE